MSWLDDILTTNQDPTQTPNLPLFGALGGLAMAATPHPGKGLGWGNALAGTIGDVAGGYGEGQVAAQKYQGANISNQMSNLALQKQQALQPLQIGMIKNALGGAANGNQSNPSFPYMAAISKPTLADQRFAQAYDMSMAFSPDKAPDVMKSWAENTPELKGAIKLSEAQNSVNSTPNGPQFGINGLPGAPPINAPSGTMPFSMSPQIAGSVLQGIKDDRQPSGIGPGAQTPPDGVNPSMGTQPPITPVQGPQQMPFIPPMGASQLQPPTGPNQPQVGPAPPMPAPPSQGMQPQQAALPPVSPQLSAILQSQAAAKQQAANQDPKAQAALQQYPQIAKDPNGQPLIAADGKPVLSSLANNPFYKADPNSQPRYQTNPESNTNAGVDAVKTQITKNVDDMSKGSQSFGELASTLSNEKTQLNQLASLFQETQTGTAAATWPQLVQHAAALGIIKDPSTIKSLADYQAMLGIGTKQVLSDLKNNSVSADGGTPMRIFGSEVNASIENATNPKLQPEALFKMLAPINGQTDRYLDMINQWQKVGGRGNRLDNGYTQLPVDFTQKFLADHPVDSYIQNWTQNTAPFKGMPAQQANGAAPVVKNYARVNGRIIQQ